MYVPNKKCHSHWQTHSYHNHHSHEPQFCPVAHTADDLETVNLLKLIHKKNHLQVKRQRLGSHSEEGIIEESDLNKSDSVNPNESISHDGSLGDIRKMWW
ncbi:hypothetical protein Btru_012842 [Bulinus truncatus]|nr:hypothetical protein Btru_012842 [Bulinus truncatus]